MIVERHQSLVTHLNTSQAKYDSVKSKSRQLMNAIVEMLLTLNNHIDEAQHLLKRNKLTSVDIEAIFNYASKLSTHGPKLTEDQMRTSLLFHANVHDVEDTVMESGSPHGRSTHVL